MMTGRSARLVLPCAFAGTPPCTAWYTRKRLSALRIPAQRDGCAGGRARDDTSTGETVVRLLDFIRTRRSQRRQALPPAPAEVEEALPKERDINTRLREEIAAAQQSGQGPWPSVKQAQYGGRARLQARPRGRAATGARARGKRAHHVDPACQRPDPHPRTGETGQRFTPGMAARLCGRGHHRLS